MKITQEEYDALSGPELHLYLFPGRKAKPTLYASKKTLTIIQVYSADSHEHDTPGFIYIGLGKLYEEPPTILPFVRPSITASDLQRAAKLPKKTIFFPD